MNQIHESCPRIALMYLKLAAGDENMNTCEKDGEAQRNGPRDENAMQNHLKMTTLNSTGTLYKLLVAETDARLLVCLSKLLLPRLIAHESVRLTTFNLM